MFYPLINIKSIEFLAFLRYFYILMPSSNTAQGEKRIMKNSKQQALTIVLSLLLVSSIAFVLIPNDVKAASTGKAYPFIEAIPNPVGKGQLTLLNIGALNFLNLENDGWNVTISVTKPDGTKDTLGPFKTFSTGTYGKSFVPDQVGNYTLQTNFLEQTYNNVTYAAVSSDPYTLEVLDQAVPSYPSQPLPSEYWVRPIDSQLRDWYSIAGSWLTKPLNLYAPYNAGPESAHVLWAQPLGDMNGGLSGGDLGDHGHETGDAYEGKFASSVIIDGVLYYNRYISGNPQQTVVAIDLHTGNQLWETNLLGQNLRLSFGQNLWWDSRNNRAVFSYLWASSGTTMYAFDAHTGNLQFNFTNVPSGTVYFGQNGELLKYSLTNLGTSANPNYYLTQWNSSWVVTNGKTGMQESWGSQVLGVTYNATLRGYDRNVSIPIITSALLGSAQVAFVGDKLIGAYVNQTIVDLWAVDISHDTFGSYLYNKVWQAPAEWLLGNITIGGIGQSGWCAWSPTDQVGVYFTKENRVSYAFSTTDGSYKWQTDSQRFEDAWSDTVTATFGPDRVIAYGTLYSATVGGEVYAYNITNGKLMWTYNATDPYHESYISNYWWTVPLFVTDGKIYIGSMEHSALDPKPRGAPFLALNATTGDLIWRIDGMFRQTRWGGRALIGDSIIATIDTYDQQVYAIGKGPTATTVSAPDLEAPYGTSVMIKGTVMDVSPGTTQDAMKLRFPTGVAAVSDASMSNWMLYVYKQFTKPSDATGVTVSIDAVDSNNNYVHLGDVATDSTGNFNYAFKPTASGTYTIYATFMGSAGYYGSYAQTALTVGAQPAATATPLPPEASVSDTYFIPAVVGIILAIVLVGAVLAVLQLRKH
jgi:outer membrane protein assembly factor BamB